MLAMAGVKALSQEPLTGISSAALVQELYKRSEWIILAMKEPIGEPITSHKGHPVWIQGILGDLGVQIHLASRFTGPTKESV